MGPGTNAVPLLPAWGLRCGIDIPVNPPRGQAPHAAGARDAGRLRNAPTMCPE
jgi:hypothetical protein